MKKGGMIGAKQLMAAAVRDAELQRKQIFGTNLRLRIELNRSV